MKGALGPEQGTQYCHVTLRRYRLWASRDKGTPSATCQLPSVHGLTTRSSAGNKCASMHCVPLQHGNSAPLRWEFWPRGRKSAIRSPAIVVTCNQQTGGALQTPDCRLSGAPQQTRKLMREKCSLRSKCGLPSASHLTPSFLKRKQRTPKFSVLHMLTKGEEDPLNK